MREERGELGYGEPYQEGRVWGLGFRRGELGYGEPYQEGKACHP